MALKSVFIRLNDPEEIAMYEQFQHIVKKQDHSDTTKMTKALWRQHIARKVSESSEIDRNLDD